MNSKNIVAITDDSICMNCLKQHDDIYEILISQLGYGGEFDNTNLKLCLCPVCYQKSNPKIWRGKTRPIIAESGLVVGSKYAYETEMLAYIEQLPLQSQELVWNRYSFGLYIDSKMDPQDWIDFKLGELSEEKCKYYDYLVGSQHNAK